MNISEHTGFTSDKKKKSNTVKPTGLNIPETAAHWTNDHHMLMVLHTDNFMKKLES